MESGEVVQWNGDSIAQTRKKKTVWCWFAVAAAINQVVELDHATDPPGGGGVGRMAAKVMASQKGFGSTVRAVAASSWGEVVVQGEATVNTVGAAIVAGDIMICHTTDGTLTEAASSATAEPQSGATTPVAVCMVAPTADPGTDGVFQWFNVYGY
jgi:hypothetical protein